MDQGYELASTASELPALPSGYKAQMCLSDGDDVKRFSSRLLENGVDVSLLETFPQGAGESVKKFFVYLGFSDTGHDLPCPFEYPVEAQSAVWAGYHWFVDFGPDEAAADQFAQTEGPMPEGYLGRTLSVDPTNLCLYFNPERVGGHLEAAQAMLRGEKPSSPARYQPGH